MKIPTHKIYVQESIKLHSKSMDEILDAYKRIKDKYPEVRDEDICLDIGLEHCDYSDNFKTECWLEYRGMIDNPEFEQQIREWKEKQKQIKMQDPEYRKMLEQEQARKEYKEKARAERNSNSRSNQ